MSWEMRGRKKVYYRKQRYRDAGGSSRVRSIYCGSDERAEAAAREDEERRRGVSPAEKELCATGETRHTQHIDARGRVARCDTPARAAEAAPPDMPAFNRRPGDVGAGRLVPTAVMQRCNSGAVDVAEAPAGAGRSEPAATAATARRRYRRDPFAPDSPYRYFLVPPRRKPPARPRYRRS